MTTPDPDKKQTPAEDMLAEQLYGFAWTGNAAALEAALAKGAPPDLLSRGETALMKAAWEGKTEIVRLLLRYKADPNLQSEKSGHSALHKAAWRGNAEIVQLLLDAGADVTLRNKYGNIPLHEAASTGSLRVIEQLVDAGAALDARNRWDLDLAGFARRYDQAEAARYLEVLRTQGAVKKPPPAPPPGKTP